MKCNYCYVKELGPTAKVIPERGGFAVYNTPKGKLLDKVRDFVCWYKELKGECSCPPKKKQ